MGQDRLLPAGALEDARGGAEAPTSPAQFDGIIEGMSITNGKADKPFGKKKFAGTTGAILGAAMELGLSGVNWSEGDFQTLAIEVTPKCLSSQGLSLCNCAGVTDVSTQELAPRCPPEPLRQCQGRLAAGARKRCPSQQVLASDDCAGVTDVSV